MINPAAMFELARTLEGVPITGCLQGSPAALAGVRYGDILLSVNGQRTKNFVDYIAAKALRAEGMSIVLFRAGEEHPIELKYRAGRSAPDPLSILAEVATMHVAPEALKGKGPSS